MHRLLITRSQGDPVVVLLDYRLIKDTIMDYKIETMVERKARGSQEPYKGFAFFSIEFSSIAEVKKYLFKEYGDKRRAKLFFNDEERNHAGYAYISSKKKLIDGKMKCFLYNHWVIVYRTTKTPVIVRPLALQKR